MSRLINIDDSRNCYIGMDGEYETWNIDPNVIAEAQPQRKTGRWTDNNACPFCGFQPWYERDIHTLSFCPNCGADMRKDGEADD